MPYGPAGLAYASVTAETASPQRLLTMLYDRLILDLSIAEAAMRTADHETTGRRLQHAQEILLELWASLDEKVWPEGEPLREVYLWLVRELMACRIPMQPERVVACRQLLEPLRDAWKQALLLQPTPEGPVKTVHGAA
jgi:flagellar secretion chaperone FliS